MRISVVCDVMANLEGSARPAICLAEGLKERGWDVSLVSPAMLGDVEEELTSKGINPVNLGARLFSKDADPSLLWMEGWSREAFFRLNSKRLLDRNTVMVNFSQMISIPSEAWYLQGPLSVALRDMSGDFPLHLRLAYLIAKTFLDWADGKLIKSMSEGSRLIVANSKFCASMYSRFGLRVERVIYPPIDLSIFYPSSLNPSSDYVLTYFGKETRFHIIKKIADKGVKVKAFGSKIQFLLSGIGRKVIRHPNIEFLGRVETNELVELYSNALFTLFPFNHEPFGYIPLESMACGTPVLTYNMQGPIEYVIDGFNGWLVNNDIKIIEKTLRLWREGYPINIRSNCVKSSLKFCKERYIKKWNFLIESLNIPFR